MDDHISKAPNDGDKYLEIRLAKISELYEMNNNS